MYLGVQDSARVDGSQAVHPALRLRSEVHISLPIIRQTSSYLDRGASGGDPEARP